MATTEDTNTSHDFQAVEGTWAYAQPSSPCAVPGCHLKRSEHPAGRRGGGQ